ncbi:hypothetical protein [Rhizobium phaseoli]|uniref:hypothetical protein n=1 Tax=Rhizobium phaseoli TaxID=396 RepID=UPI00143831D9|nr:hypothetical protein [Rhizobium phaseoli]MDK4726404.1 hypothetical protein [Rhizobium phaseoli]NKE89585.1 hypothetical protein [Rhizobium phaseoli]
MEDEEEKTSQGHNGFFAIDPRRWTEACADGMNSAISYLILCRGTGGDNRTTSWSVMAIEKWSGISRPRAQKAIDLHIKKGRVELLRGGRNPQYRIAAFEDDSDDMVAGRIWLPNTLIDGAIGEQSSIEYIRQNGNVKALELLVNLYEQHFLATDGGIEWRRGKGIRVSYSREKVTDYGEFSIWTFTSHREPTAWEAFPPYGKFPDASAFWESWRLLVDLGLVAAVAHLVESDSDEGEVMHPLPYDTNGLPHEKDIAEAAHDAGFAMMAEWRQDHPDFYTDDPLVPLKRHFHNVELVGIFRLRYMPHTRATADWMRKQREWADIAEDFRALKDMASRKMPKSFKEMQYKG